MNVDFAELLKLLSQAPGTVLAVLVWWELRGIRDSFTALSADLAGLRARLDGPSSGA